MYMKVNPRTLKSDWSRYERRPPWSVVSSRELAGILGVHLQTISNWTIRGILPLPVKHPRLKANKNYFRISTLREWLEGRAEEGIQWEWLQKWMPEQIPYIHHLPHAERWLLLIYKELGLEKPLIPADFTDE